MNRIRDFEDEDSYKNDLGRENRSAIKRSIIMALMALGALAAAVLLAPPSDPKSMGLDGSDSSTSVAAPAALPEPTDSVGGSFFTRHRTPPDEKVEISFY